MALLACFTLIGCQKKSYLERSNADKALNDAVRKLQKDPENEAAQDAVPILYAQIKKDHLARIASLKSSGENNIRDRIISEYELLQQAYNSILNCPAAFRLVTPDSYASQLLEMKQSAAEEYYSRAMTNLFKGGRNNAKLAYADFNTAQRYQPGYKDVVVRLQQAFDSAMVRVVIYPVQEPVFSSVSFNSSGGPVYGKEQMQQDLIQQLGGINNNNLPAKFYSDREIFRENIKPDWMVDMEIKNIDLQSPSTTNSSRNCNKEIQIATDSNGMPKYQTVTATLAIQRTRLNVPSKLGITIRDLKAGTVVRQETFSESYNWTRETATYTGDRRALSTADLNLLNAATEPLPSRDVIMGALYKEYFPRVKSLILKEAGW